MHFKLLIQKKHRLTPFIARYVNWKAHGLALKKRMPSRQTHLIKVVHDVLPTTGLAN